MIYKLKALGDTGDCQSTITGVGGVTLQAAQRVLMLVLWLRVSTSNNVDSSWFAEIGTSSVQYMYADFKFCL